jgi:predicted alpha/beta hydrolase family esterase
MTPITLILPGLFNSGPDHWQSHWERLDSGCRRVEQADWDTPRCADWVTTLDSAVARVSGSAVLVAHSSACAAVAHWAATAPDAHLSRVQGALLVAPSDPEGPQYPAGPTGFAPVPQKRLPFPSIVVASTDDVYVTLERAREYATNWGSRFVNVGAAGHINSTSGLGDWPAGYALLAELRGPREGVA